MRPFEPLGIVIPAFNAERHITGTLDDVFAWLDGRGRTAEIVVVDDGSTDHTAERVRRYPRPVGLLRNGENRGKGYSVRTGVLAVVRALQGKPDDRPEGDGGWVLFMDADNSTPIRHLDRFAPEVERGADVVIGTRRAAGARIVRRQHLFRRVLGQTFPYLVRWLCLPALQDTQCGFKVFRAALAGRVFAEARVDRFAFDVEVLLIAQRLGARIRESPVDWENPTQSTLKIARDAPRMLWDALRSAWKWRERGPAVRRLRASVASSDNG